MADSTNARAGCDLRHLDHLQADGPKRSPSPSVAITTGAALWAR